MLTIRKDAKMSEAHDLLHAHRILHLPELERGKVRVARPNGADRASA